MAVGDVGPGPFQGVAGKAPGMSGSLTPQMEALLRQLFPVDQPTPYPLPRPAPGPGMVNSRIGPVSVMGVKQGPGVPLGLNQLPALPPGQQPLALNPAPSVIAGQPVPGQTPNYIAQGTIPGKPIPMGPAGGNAPPLAPNSTASVTPQNVGAGKSTLFADPNTIDINSLRNANPRVYPNVPDMGGATRYANPSGPTIAPNVNAAGTYTSTIPASTLTGGNAGLGPHGPAFNQYQGGMGQSSVGAGMAADTAMAAQLGRSLKSGSIGSSVLPDSLTKSRTGKFAGTANRLLPALGGLAAAGFVNEYADPNASLGPINKDTLNATTGGIVAGSVGGVPGAIAGGVGAGAGDVAAPIVNADTKDMNLLGQLGTGLLRGSLAIPGMVAGFRDETDTEAQGGLTDIFKPGGKLGAVGGLFGVGGEPEPEPEVVTPQNMMDRVFDLAKTPSDTRMQLQELYTILTANGADPEEASASIRQAAIDEYTTRQQEQQDSAKVLAQQAQTRKYMQPYADSIRAQGAAEQQLLQALSARLPAEYQGYAAYAANSAPVKANSAADAYMAQAMLAPSQYQQQQAYRQQQAINAQLQQRLQAQGISEQVDLFNSGGIGINPLNGQGGGL